MPPDNAEVRVTCQGADLVPLDSVLPFQGKLKTLSDRSFDKLKTSILKYGISFPLFVWKHKDTLHTLDGHQRDVVLKRMSAEGYHVPPVPVDYIEAGTVKEAKEKILLLSSQYGKMTDDSLSEFISDAEIDMEEMASILDLPTVDVDAMLEGMQPEPPEAPEAEMSRADELQEKWLVKLGDVWEIGRHRLMCGDCMDMDAVTVLMSGESVSALITDPPYGMSLDTDFSGMKNNLEMAQEKGLKSGNKYDRVIGDDKPFDAGPIVNNFGNPAEQFWFGADYYSTSIGITESTGAWLVWDKRLEESADKMFGSCFELLWSKKKRKRDILRVKWAGVFGTEHKPQRGRVHPTQKPVRLIVEIIQKTEGLIADPFLGSGTTMVAAEQLGRVCYGMEISPAYCSVILERMAEMGLEPRKLGGDT